LAIRALAKVTLDARAFAELGPETIDRLADRVEARLIRRRAAGEEPLLSAVAAAKLVDVSAETIRRRSVQERSRSPATWARARVCIGRRSRHGSLEASARRLR